MSKEEKVCQTNKELEIFKRNWKKKLDKQDKIIKII